jgi:hypothetical protein
VSERRLRPQLQDQEDQEQEEEEEEAREEPRQNANGGDDIDAGEESSESLTIDGTLIGVRPMARKAGAGKSKKDKHKNKDKDKEKKKKKKNKKKRKMQEEGNDETRDVVSSSDDGDGDVDDAVTPSKKQKHTDHEESESVPQHPQKNPNGVRPPIAAPKSTFRPLSAPQAPALPQHGTDSDSAHHVRVSTLVATTKQQLG